MIDTLLQKYDSLQRMSHSWGLSSEKSLWGEGEWTGDGRGIGEDIYIRGTLDDLHGFNDPGHMTAEFGQDPQELLDTEIYCWGKAGRDCSFNTQAEDFHLVSEENYTSFPLHYESAESNNPENAEIVKQTSLFFGLNLVGVPQLLCLPLNTHPLFQDVAPPLPPRRSYTVEGGVRRRVGSREVVGLED